jgi:hypothetical protein
MGRKNANCRLHALNLAFLRRHPNFDFLPVRHYYFLNNFNGAFVVIVLNLLFKILKRRVTQMTLKGFHFSLNLFRISQFKGVCKLDKL